MKKLLLSGVAVPFLATGTAYAYPPRYYNCGKAFVKIQTFHGSAAMAGSFRRCGLSRKIGKRKIGKSCLLLAH